MNNAHEANSSHTLMIVVIIFYAVIALYAFYVLVLPKIRNRKERKNDKAIFKAAEEARSDFS